MRIGILTGGGDVPGLNACIRSITLSALDLGWQVTGIRRGWQGLLDVDPTSALSRAENLMELGRETVRGVDRVGGTMLHSSRLDPRTRPEGDRTREVLEKLTALGIDADEARVNEFAHDLTHVVHGDPTNEETLRELGVADFDAAVVAIGSSLEASILSASLLIEAGVKQVWAKANSTSHGRILTQIGVHHVIFPEYEMGRRVAHQVSGESLDYVHIDEDFVMVKTYVPQVYEGAVLAEAKIRATFGVTVVAINDGNGYKPAFPDTVLRKGNTIVIAGPKGPLDQFCQLD